MSTKDGEMGYAHFSNTNNSYSDHYCKVLCCSFLRYLVTNRRQYPPLKLAGLPGAGIKASGHFIGLKLMMAYFQVAGTFFGDIHEVR
jgi:hypothetical protein